MSVCALVTHSQDFDTWDISEINIMLKQAFSKLQLLSYLEPLHGHRGSHLNPSGNKLQKKQKTKIVVNGW